jgi:hypothetical protein
MRSSFQRPFETARPRESFLTRRIVIVGPAGVEASSMICALVFVAWAVRAA